MPLPRHPTPPAAFQFVYNWRMALVVTAAVPFIAVGG